MKIGATPFISENIAPPNAKRLKIFNGDDEVCTVDISKMQPSNLGEKLYSFGLLGDMHIGSSGHDGYLEDALDLFVNKGCNFWTHTGDITNLGFYDVDGNFSTAQFDSYNTIIRKDKYNNLPVYGICGNHESYNDTTLNKCIMDNLDKLLEYTGTPLYYTMTSEADNNPTEMGGNIYNEIIGNDVFIFVGQPSQTPTSGYRDVWEEQLNWLEETLSANKDKRCFVYEHLTLTDDAGNPNNIHNAFWGDLESRLFSILNHYKNVIVIHGHSHLDLGEQLNFSYANYTAKNGFKSIHAGAPCGGRITVDGVLQKNEGVNGCGKPTKRCGYVVDVYKNHIVLKGYYFATGELIPIAQYCISN